MQHIRAFRIYADFCGFWQESKNRTTKNVKAQRVVMYGGHDWCGWRLEQGVGASMPGCV